MFCAAELTDQVLCAATDGSRDDLEQVFKAMRPQIRVMVMTRLGATSAQFEAVDGVVQQVATALAAGIKRLEDRTVGGPKAFAPVIVGRKVADLLKERGEGKRDPPIASLDSTVATLPDASPLWQFLSGSGTSPLSAVQQAEQAARLLSKLGRLELWHREVITLAFFDQLPISEIAERMNISRPAASMRLI